MSNQTLNPKTRHSSLVTRHSTAAVADRALQPTARDHYLAEHPEARRLQEVQIAQINRGFAEWKPKMKATATNLIERTEEARQIGIAIVEFEETLPGKKLTVDLWQQLQQLFVDDHGQRIPRETLEWLVKIARGNPLPVDNLLTALQWRQPLLLACGDESFALAGERAPQVAHAPANPLSLLKEQFNPVRLADTLKQLRGDANYCPGGCFREDLRETLRVELEPTFKIVDELRRELGV